MPALCSDWMSLWALGAQPTYLRAHWRKVLRCHGSALIHGGLVSQLSVMVVQNRRHESWIASLGGGGGFFGSSLIWRSAAVTGVFLGASSGPDSLVWVTVFGPERPAGEAQEVCCVSSERQCAENERND